MYNECVNTWCFHKTGDLNSRVNHRPKFTHKLVTFREYMFLLDVLENMFLKKTMKINEKEI